MKLEPTDVETISIYPKSLILTPGLRNIAIDYNVLITNNIRNLPGAPIRDFNNHQFRIRTGSGWAKFFDEAHEISIISFKAEQPVGPSTFGRGHKLPLENWSVWIALTPIPTF